MHRFSTIRTKLLFIVLVPTLAMLALGVRQVATEAGHVRTLDATTRMVSVFESAPPAIDALGRFRIDMARGTTPPEFGPTSSRAKVTESLNRFQLWATTMADDGTDRFRAALATSVNLARAVDIDAPWPKPTDIDAAIDALTDLTEVASFEVDDESLGRTLGGVSTLSRYLVVARQNERVLLEYAGSGIDSGRYTVLVANRERAAEILRSYTAIASPQQTEAVRELTGNPSTQSAEQVLNRLIVDGPASTVREDVGTSFSALDAAANGVHTVVGDLSKETLATAEVARDEAQRELVLHVALVLGGIVTAVALAVLVARSISSRLRRVAVAATDIADVRLPKFLQAVENPDLPIEAIDADLPTLGRTGHDEVGEVMRAFELVQESTVTVAKEHAHRIRHGIDSTFVNLARRNQAALTRQLDAVHWLRDHEVLDDAATDRLDLIDQLGRGLRRNAENLLVLSGVELGSNRVQPMRIGTLITGAAREVGDPRRVTAIGLTDLSVTGSYVDDLRRMLVELLDNAFTFSPPTERVIVSIDEGEAGRIVVSVRDHGIGMPDDRLDEANSILDGDATVGLEMSRRLGLNVVGTIARRIGAAVRVSAGNGGGVAVRITLGLLTFVDPDEIVVDDEPVAGSSPAEVPADRTPVTATPDDSARAREAVLAHLAGVDPKTLVDQYR